MEITNNSVPLHQFFDTITKAVGSAIEMPIRTMQKTFLKIREITIEVPGAIIGIAELEPITSGWVVRVAGATDFEGENGLKKAIAVGMVTSKKIAGYRDEEIELWDVVEVFDDEDEAMKAARFFGQMTIYQIETGTLKWIE